MNRIVEAMQDHNLQESWGEVIDVTEFMTDSTGFFNTNGLGAFTQIYDRSDGRFRPVYTNESDLKLIRAMSWLLVEKVPMAQAWVNRLLDYTIGTGFDWTIKAEDRRLEKAIQLYVRETLDNSHWSTELERESYVREVADGECITVLDYDDGQCLVTVREGDELTEPAIKGELEDWLGLNFVPSWTFGVLTKQSLPERPIGYHFVRNSAGTDWDYVPADRVCMWKRNVRGRGKRGFSDFYKPHLYLLRADRVLTNTAEGAATQAAIAYIVEHRDGQQRQADNIVKRFAPLTGKVDPLTGLAQRRRRMLPGTRLDVPEGQQYKAGLLGSNNSGIYIEVMESALRLAGSVHAFPEGMLTGSYENNNLASALVAEGPFMQGRIAEQAQRKERVRDLLLKIIKNAARKRRFASVGFESWDAIEMVLTVEVIPSRIIPMDPMKTTQALALQKQNGWVSDKTAINELGRDIDTETANGLKVGAAEQQPGAPAQPGKPQAPDEQPGNVSSEDGKWLGLSRLQWQRNRKAVADVLTDFANGKTRRSVAKVLLRAIGMPENDIETMLRDAMDGQIDSLPPEGMTEAEKKTLNKPFRTPDGPKKFAVYAKNEKGNVIKVTFGDPKMKIQRDKPGRRRGFRARHNCENPGPKWKARYWSCRFWSKPSVTKLLKESFRTGEVPWDGRTFVRESWLLKHNPALREARCPTGKKGGVDNSCKWKKGARSTTTIPSVKASDGVINNLLQFGQSPFSGILNQELLNAGATELGIKEFESLVDGHRYGGEQQAYADAKFAENVAADNDLGKAIRASIAIEEAAIEAWNGGVGQQHMDRLAAEQMRHVEWMHKNGMIDTDDYPTPKAYFDEREAWQYQFEPMRFYRKGEEKTVMPTSTRSEGGQSYSVTGAAQPKFSPDRSWSYEELKSKGYRVLGGFGQAFGYQGESETSWIKVPKSMAESYRGLREEKDGDGDGMVNDGKPSERPAGDSDKPKKQEKKDNAHASRDESRAKHIFSSLQEALSKNDAEESAIKTKLKAAKTHEETLELSKKLHQIEQKSNEIKWNAATEYGAFHAENPGKFRDLREQYLINEQKVENDKFAILVDWASDVRMRPGVEVSAFHLARGGNSYDPEAYDQEEASKYTENNSLEKIQNYESQLKNVKPFDDHTLTSQIYQAYFNEPDSISDKVLGDGSVAVPEKVKRGGADSSLKRFMQTAMVAVQVDPKLLSSIADKGVLSASEGGKKGVGSKKTGDAKKQYHAVRRELEDDLFGIPDKPDKPDQSRPIYGLIDNPDRLLSSTVGAARNYGAAQVVLKPDVKSRTSYTIGDSLDDYRFGGITAAVNDPIDHSSIAPMRFYRNPSDAEKNPSTTRAGSSAGEFRVTTRSDAGTREKIVVPQYIEAQVHGGISPSDISEVRIPRGSASPSAIKKLQKAGISVREIPPPPVKMFYNIIPDWEKIGND